MYDIQTENTRVQSCWNEVRKDLKKIVESKHGELKTCGIRFWDRPIKLSNQTGQWSDRGMASKPSRWLLTCNSKGTFINFADRMAYFSLRNEALAFAVRAVPIIRTDERETYEFIDHTEWIIIFIAKSLTPRGSSSATAHASRLAEGLITITTDDREFEVPLDCVGIIKPDDKLSSPFIAEIERTFQKTLAHSLDCYDLNIDSIRREFLSRVDQLQVTPKPKRLSKEGTWMSDEDLFEVESIFHRNEPYLMLWGNDESSLEFVVDHLEGLSEHEFVHLEALPTWDEYTLFHILDSDSMTDKVICIHAAERLNPNLTVPIIAPKKRQISLISSSGHMLAQPKSKPHSWIFIAHRLELSEIKQWHKALRDQLKWFRCEVAISPVDAVKLIYQQENVQATSVNWFDNLFVLMWEELATNLPISIELLATIVRNCLRQDATGVWDLDATPIQKEILVEEILISASPLIVSLPPENRKRCLNSLIGILEIPQSQSRRLLSLANVL